MACIELETLVHLHPACCCHFIASSQRDLLERVAGTVVVVVDSNGLNPRIVGVARIVDNTLKKE